MWAIFLIYTGVTYTSQICCMVVSNCALFGSKSLQSGNRTSGVKTSGYIAAKAAFTGTGLLSIKRSLNNWLNLRAMRWAPTISPLFIKRTILDTSDGMIFDATLITQLAPTLINGNVSPSSHESIWKSCNQASSRATLIFLTLFASHPASLIAIIFGHSLASFRTVSILISIQHLPWIL